MIRSLAGPLFAACLTLGLFGCERGAAPVAGCDGPDCRVGLVIEQASQDMSAAPDAINRLPDEIEQLLAVEGVILGSLKRAPDAPGAGHHPGVGLACERLASERVRTRCDDLSSRPHLFAEGPTASDEHSRAAVSDALAILMGCLEGCRPSETPLECAVRTEEVARTSTDEAPGVACACLSDAATRGECSFQAAERALREDGVEAYDTAVTLCSLAETFSGQCLGHLQTILLEAHPDSPCGDDPDGWNAAADTGNAIRSTWNARDKEVDGHRWVHEFWKSWFAATFASQCCVDPVRSAALMPEALPHLRAVVAWWVVAEEPTLGLESLVDRGEAVLAGTAPCGGTTPRLGREQLDALSTRTGRFGLVTMAGGDPHVIPFPGPALRRTSDDIHADMTICVLEAGARLHDDLPSLLDAAGDPTDPDLAATVDRLRAAIED